MSSPLPNLIAIPVLIHCRVGGEDYYMTHYFLLPAYSTMDEVRSRVDAWLSEQRFNTRAYSRGQSVSVTPTCDYEILPITATPR